MSRKVHALRHEIERLQSEELRSSLKWYVLNHIQQRYKTDEEIERFCRDVSLLGCFFRSILMDRLEVCRFFEKYYKDIFTLLQPLNFNSTEHPKKHEIKSDNHKKDFVHAGFEQTVRRITEDLNMEI